MNGTQNKHAFLAYGMWAILSLGGGAGLFFFFLYTLGLAGLIPALSAACAAFVAWFPTQGSARGRSANYRLWCMGLVFISGCLTAFTAGTAAQMLLERATSEQIRANNEQRAKAITDAATTARKGGLTSRRSVEVARESAALLKADAEREKAALIVESPDPAWLREFKAKWMRFIEWGNALLTFAVQSLLFVFYRKSEDQDGDGIPDYLEQDFPEQLDVNAGK